ncbi:MAG: hypothetical protein A2166_02100 [Omnitrophica WOR_2 bacterium RBG_13_41_10]|nr:MAG: hypothetical protein A2166_02100 [Omnitrophica WOR_2 bacterium RBG_13_41_10]
MQYTFIMKIKRTDFAIVDEFFKRLKKSGLSFSKQNLADMLLLDIREIYRFLRHEAYPHPDVVKKMQKISKK